MVRIGLGLCAVCLLAVGDSRTPVYSVAENQEKYEITTQRGVLFAVEHDRRIFQVGGLELDFVAVTVVRGTHVCARHVGQAGAV